jgi:hypothetical protein
MLISGGKICSQIKKENGKGKKMLILIVKEEMIKIVFVCLDVVYVTS